MTHAAPSPDRSTDSASWLEPLSAVVLGLAAVLTAVAAYLTSIEAGKADDARALQLERTSTANALANAATQIRAADQAMFAAWAESSFGKDEDLTDYLLTLMRPELNTAIDVWADSPDEVMTPFELDEYVIQEALDAETARAEAAAAEAKAVAAGAAGGEYAKSTIFLALALFFAGVAAAFRRRGFSGGLLGAGSIALVIGGVQLFMA